MKMNTINPKYFTGAYALFLGAMLMVTLMGAPAAFAAGPAAVDLGTAGNFAILSYNGISSVPQSHITGNIGVSVAGGGVSLVIDPTEVIGGGIIYSPDAAGPSGSTIAPGLLGIAMGDITTAYGDALSRPTGLGLLNVGNGAGEIGGLVLAPGVYTFTGESINVVISTALTLTGNSDDVWIFQIPGTFDVHADVNLGGNAQARNIFWTVADATTIFPGFTVNGNILAQTSIAMQSLATLNGRALSKTAAVTLVANTITKPADVGPATQLLVETAADGSGTVVPAQSIVTGSFVTVYAITRDASNNFVANVAADSWALTNVTGGVVPGDLVQSGDRKSAEFTGHATGTAEINAIFGTLAAINSGMISIIPGAATKFVIAGNSTQIAGEAQDITITAKDNEGNTAAIYTGDKILIFSGANPSSNPVNEPTVTDKVGTAVAFGSATTITFANGVATASAGNNGVMTLYEIETANIVATQGIITTTGSDRLTVTVEGAIFVENEVAPNEFTLSQNFPNPFNPSTTIQYSLGKAGMVSLKVYNMVGQEVATLVNDRQEAGSYTLTFNANGLSTGVYFYRLETGSSGSMKKLVLMK